MKKTGELLKQKRESANLSVSEVALATKINPKILTAIENGDEKNLPAKTFLKGFVRSYALFLKMDVDEVMRLFTEETGGPPAPTLHEAYRQPEPSSAQGPSRRRPPPGEGSAGLRTAAVIVIALLIGLIIGVRELIEKYQKEKIVTAGEVKVSPLVTPPVVPQPSAPTVAVDAKPVEEPAKEAAKEPVKDEPAKEPAKAEPEVKEAAAPPPPAPAPTPEPEPIVGIPRALMAPRVVVEPVAKPAKAEPEAKPAEVKIVESKPVETRVEDKPVQEAKVNEPASTPPPSVIKSLKNEIILEALDKVDVEFKVHGETKRLSLGPTEVHTIRTDGPMTLDFSDGGAVNIILNGRERGVPGDLGKPKQVKLP